MTFQIKSECGTDLSSRRAARELRAKVIAAVQQKQIAVLDFTDVRTVSQSFADELLAILVVEFGEKWFLNHIKLVNLDRYVRESILLAIQERFSSIAST